MADIRISEHSGFCFGVKRAVDMINKSLEEDGRGIYCLGELIHNRIFNESLVKRGVSFIERGDIPKLKSGAKVFLRAHGTVKELVNELEARGIEYIDATCPYVSKIHKIVASQPAEAKVMLIGDAKHPEVEGIMSWAKGEGIVFADLADIEARHEAGFVVENDCILAVQTTYSGAEWEKCKDRIKELYPNVRIYETICGVTENRQKSM
ncbi:MAG: bifunctional 4-hydroxy-3-methylbut-2-enyl diphosphate reductase/30S ribosomal protein S1, partial [Clostridia bacterium]|nr:bifunctional 4-hydroxy-3-methylbut-2-enyl diphosphate reductase/30S ribosomal protein S1 [Clostridia bacterium]